MVSLVCAPSRKQPRRSKDSASAAHPSLECAHQRIGAQTALRGDWSYMAIGVPNWQNGLAVEPAVQGSRDVHPLTLLPSPSPPSSQEKSMAPLCAARVCRGRAVAVWDA
jgi:hypothetical protein